MKKKTAVIALMLAMVISFIPAAGMNAYAVSGGTVAADDTYSAAVTVSKYKKGKYDKSYYGTVYMTVADGKISNLSVYAYDKQDRFNELLNAVKYRLIGQPATSNAVDQVVDGVTSASINGGGTNTGYDAISGATSDSSKTYVSNLGAMIKSMMSSAPAASSGGNGSEEPAGTLKDGTYTANLTADNGKYNGTVTVTVENGQITDISVEANGNWDTPLSDAKGNLMGKTSTDGVDAISSATQYSQALEDAINEAIAKAKDESGGGDSPGDDPTDPSGDDPQGDDLGTLNPGQEMTIYVGDKVTLLGTDSYTHDSSKEKWNKGSADGGDGTGSAETGTSRFVFTGTAAGTVVVEHIYAKDFSESIFTDPSGKEYFTIHIKERETTDPTDPTDPTNPSDPTDPTDPTDPSDSTDPTGHQHSWGAWEKLNETRHQRVCADDKTHIQKADHVWDKGKVSRKATMKAAGTMTYTCNICGAVKSASIPKVTLGTPKAGTTSKAGGKMLVSWKKVNGANGYIVSWKKAGASGWSIKKTSSTKISLNGMKNGAMYQYRVAATKKATTTTAAVTGKYSAVRYRYYKSLAGKSYKAGKKSITAKWKKDSSATGYQVLIAGNKKMTGAKVYTVGKAKNSYTVRGLKKGKTYYMAVRPIKKSGGKTYVGIRETYGKAVKVK